MISTSRWLLLLHHLPPKPPYFRAKVLRRLAQVGALPLKNSAYLMPDNEDTLEDLEWIAQEIRREGGGVWLFRADLLAGQTAEEIVAGFVKLREPDYLELLTDLGEISQLPQEEVPTRLARSTRRWEEIRQIDFFASPLRDQVVDALRSLATPAVPQRKIAEVAGRTWVTRKGVRVDRIGSAWLIRRFIDADAQFRFAQSDYVHAAGDLRFDMYEGEYTHRGDLCTFEVLLEDFGLTGDAGLAALGDMVHDIDLKDERHRRPETPGLSRMLDGLCRGAASDEERLQLGKTIFDSLYESLR